MDQQDWRALLHGLGVLGWIAGLARDAEDRRWGIFAVAVGFHVAAELIGNADPT